MGVQNPNSTDYVHSDEPNLLNIHKAMQYRNDGTPELRVNSTFEGNIVISGNVNIPGEVTVSSTPENPVHVHLTELGTFGNLTTFVPIQGNVVVSGGNLTVQQGTTPWVTTGNANVTVIGNIAGITTLPAITGNVGVSGNVSISQLPGITGNVRIYGNIGGSDLPITVNQGTTPWVTTGNANVTVIGNIGGITTLPAVTGNVGVSGNVAVLGNIVAITTLPAITGNVGVSGNVNIGQLPGITGNVRIYGNIGGSDLPVTVNQGTTPWQVQGNVTVNQTAGSPTLVKYSNNNNLQMDMVDRLRVASTSQMWWYAPTIDKDGDLRYIESITGTNAASTFVQNLSSINLTSGTDANGSLIRISRRRHKLLPGISMLSSFSINWNGYVPDGNVTKRVGMFTNYNGIFFEMTGDLAVVIRRRLTDGTLVERRVPRTSFTEDRLDGTGSTGYDLRPVVKQTANITAHVSTTPVVIGGNGGTVYRVIFTVSDPTQFFVSQKGRITGVTPTLFNGTVMVTAISGSNVTFVYNQNPGAFSSLSSAKFEHTNLHHQYVFGFDFTGTRVGKCRFFMDSPLGRTAIHVEDFGDEISTPFVNAPAMSLRYEIVNSGAPGRLPNLTVSSEMVNIEAEAVLNPGFGTAQRSTALAINKGVRTEYALLGVGLRTGEPNQRADLQVQNLQIIDAGNVNTQNAGVYQWRLVMNPSFAGTAVPTPTDVGKCTRTWNYNNGTTISGGVTLLSGYLTSTTELDVFTALNFLNLGSNIAYDDADKLVLAIKMVVDGTSDAALLATMNFIEAL
jgi:hypothetical protein